MSLPLRNGLPAAVRWAPATRDATDALAEDPPSADALTDLAMARRLNF